MDALAEIRAPQVAGVMRTFRDVLVQHQQAINALNVYPVPDGDTGTNMALTLESVVAEIDQLGGEPSMADVCRAVSHGSLMGARGNSGVILSQLLRGLAGALAGVEAASGATVAAGLRAASTAADAAVLRPVEGTILSVARSAAAAVSSMGEESGLVAVVQVARSAAAAALDRTPEQLPVLARAGVVDAGGAGFVLLLDALLHEVAGAPVSPPPAGAPVADSAGGLKDAGAPGVRGMPGGQSPGRGGEGPGHGDQVPGVPAGALDASADESIGALRYEVMYLLDAPDDTIGAFKEVWAGLGDSIVVVGGDGLWNCHIHTDDVGGAIEAALDAGRPRDIRVTDLREQVDEVRWVREGTASATENDELDVRRQTAVVVVANGDGIRRIFRSLGVRHFVSGGQSMNPSTAQILEVVAQVGAPEVVLLPNNDNIHPVARQVSELADRPVEVVPTGSIVEGFAALLEYDPEASAVDNAAAMAGSARRVVAGEVVRAVRDASGPSGPVRSGDWLGLSRQGIEVVEDSVVTATTSLIGKLLGHGHELVTLIEGEGASAGDTRRVTEWLAESHPQVAVEVHHGGQPLYPYLISIE